MWNMVLWFEKFSLYIDKGLYFDKDTLIKGTLQRSMKCFGYLFVSLDYKLFQTRSHHLVQGCISATNRSLDEDTYADKRFVSN